MTQTKASSTGASGAWAEPKPTALLVLADGTVVEGFGFGATGHAVGEVCFNTAMTGYQEILTDPSYMAQIVAFTFPHVGNVGVNLEDLEQISGSATTSARGAIFRDVPTGPANWRADSDLPTWMARRGVIGIAGVDTRALTRHLRTAGAMRCGLFSGAAVGELPEMLDQVRAQPPMAGADLTGDVSTPSIETST